MKSLIILGSTGSIGTQALEVAKKDGYKNTPFTLDTKFNPVSIINLTCIIAWAIDLGTGKCCKWDADIVEIEMEKSESDK